MSTFRDMYKGVISVFFLANIVHFGCTEKVKQEHEPSDILGPNRHCWGYEAGCETQNSNKTCPDEDYKDFHREADFGYVQQRLYSVKVMCEPEDEENDSKLECADRLQYCSGKNIMVDFTNLPSRREELLRYSTDVLSKGQIRAKCNLKQQDLDDQMLYDGALQSWAPELRNFVGQKVDLKCDFVVKKPVFFMKLDAAVNLYHHFCDFFNLYASMHMNGSFNTDVHVLIWENRPYRSSFGEAFKAFTRHPLWDLNTFGGRKVCFEQVILPLLPRMLFGLYYNTPLSNNDCKGSDLFRAFAQFVPDRLGIQRAKSTDDKKLRVTILSRQTKHRRILNLDDLVNALIATGKYDVTVAPFNHNYPFWQQMQVIRTTDILIGIHGAGLAHMLFLPDWATIFELYDCQDPACYKELAKLRGVEHISWDKMDKVYPEVVMRNENEPQFARAKFTNYAFDVLEFLNKVSEAADHVVSHPQFQQLNNNNNNTKKKHEEL